MSPLLLKRLFVWTVGMLIGFVGTYLTITVGFDMLPLISSIQSPQGVSIEEYGYLYFLVTAVPLGLVFVIILDAFVDSKILPD
jgi:ABC-type lipoprotein release transport system permease subunit